MARSQYPQLVWTADLVAKYWDWQSQYPENYFTYQFGDGVVTCLRRYLRRRDTVLDYGCGPGFLIPHLAANGNRVVGTDFSSDSIEYVRNKHADVSGFEGAFSIVQLLQSKRKFDVVLCIEVVEHLYDELLDQLLQNVGDLLAPDGYALFTTPNKENLERNFVYCPQSDVVFHRWQHVRSWDKQSLGGYLEQRGFRVVDAFETNIVRYCGRGLKRVVRNFLNDRLGAPRTPHLVCVARPG